MKKYKFVVTLEGLQKKVWAFTEKEAVNSVRADALKRGLNHKLVYVRRSGV